VIDFSSAQPQDEVLRVVNAAVVNSSFLFSIHPGTDISFVVLPYMTSRALFAAPFISAPESD